ncbi:ATP-binding cassette domain-containing protein [Salmonella enterica subsp. enterica]|nr:ATP-binding cassette domain-containing protein [Salmonella enterica subsp. enterica]
MKKALLVVSFGTSYHDTCEKNIVACERDLAASCPDRDLFRAFTSGMIIRKLRQRDGIDIDTPLQALQKLAAQGYQDVAIQSLHIINGDEYEKIVREVQLLRPLFTRLTLGVPLLSSHNDYVQLMQALRQQMPSLRQTEKVVFMGHGASHHAFAAYACLDHMMTAQRFPARVGAVESYPEVDILIDSLRDEGVTGVHLMPLMLVAGDHAINDMASDDGDSWKMRFNAAGIPATPWLSGLGENPAIRAMFVAHLHQALNMAVTLVDAQHFRHQPIQCLSHGQKKRVAIAGALVLQARYLLLDEPTAGLDPAGRTQMIAIIRRIVAQGNHVIISSHDIDLIYEISDAVYVLRQGQILTHGAPGEVFACTEAMEQAGLTQPWLVKLHTQLGLPLCKTETEFFHRMQKCAFREAS